MHSSQRRPPTVLEDRSGAIVVQDPGHQLGAALQDCHRHTGRRLENSSPVLLVLKVNCFFQSGGLRRLLIAQPRPRVGEHYPHRVGPLFRPLPAWSSIIAV